MGRSRIDSPYPFGLKDPALKDLKKIDPFNKKRILKKLKYFASQANPMDFATKITDPKIGTYRWRVGHYRILFDVKNDKYIILRIQHRREVYRK